MGGSGGKSSTDYAYNARMATIAESQQEMADAYFQFWETEYKGYESAQIQANMSLLSGQTDLQGEVIAAQTSLVRPEANLIRGQLESATRLTPGLEQTNLQVGAAQSEFLQQAQEGINIEDRIAQAQATTSQAFDQARTQLGQGLQRLGRSASGSQVANQLGDLARDEALAKTTAANTARRLGETENFLRLGEAVAGARLDVAAPTGDASATSTTTAAPTTQQPTDSRRNTNAGTALLEGERRGGASEGGFLSPEPFIATSSTIPTLGETQAIAAAKEADIKTAEDAKLDGTTRFVSDGSDGGYSEVYKGGEWVSDSTQWDSRNT